MKSLAIVTFCLVVAVVLALYGGDRREKREQRAMEQRVRDAESMQSYGRRTAAQRTEAAERAQTEGPDPAPAPTPEKKGFSKEEFDREQERRDAETRRRVERERRDYEREVSRREYEAQRDDDRARREALIRE